MEEEKGWDWKGNTREEKRVAEESEGRAGERQEWYTKKEEEIKRRT